MHTIASAPAHLSQSEVDIFTDLAAAREVAALDATGGVRLVAAQGRRNLWLRLALGGTDVLALRLGPNAGAIEHVECLPSDAGELRIAFATPLGAMRAHVRTVAGDHPVVRCTTSLLPLAETTIAYYPRDLYPLGATGTVHTAQRGLRSGIVFASTSEPVPLTFLYFQNFSALTDYFEATKRSPADTVGGRWPELGYAPPSGASCTLPKAVELVVSDAYVALAPVVPSSNGESAAAYLDLLASVYLALDRPASAYHDWAGRAERTLRDLTLSPACTYVHAGRRFLMPYVGDTAKPPESMVQFTLAVNAGEYDRWRGAESALARALRATAGAFYDAERETVVRWLPGASFDEQQAEELMNHRAMDSWYLHHALFNLWRLARDGDAAAKELFAKSLPYAVRVAHRFSYHWPIFFDLSTLDVIRAESAPGQGGETDVAGLYGLVMLHAAEMFDEPSYRLEAEAAVQSLEGLGFELAYQLNTTGFAAEAALRLWRLTRRPEYLAVSEVCLANLLDNMWLWRCGYGNARAYPTFFGLFPLRDAPYLAAYEEMEAHAKFHEYLSTAGDELRPALRLLLAEYQKYLLDRGWYYYPDALPADALASDVRNGTIERALSVPVEDLQDGFTASGSVGQEIYGAGLAFVLTARHYMRVPGTDALVYANYPMYDFTVRRDGRVSWRCGGDPRGTAELRVIPASAGAAPLTVEAWTRAGAQRVPLQGAVSPEGHAVFPLRGGQTVEIRCRRITPRTRAAGALRIGALAASPG